MLIQTDIRDRSEGKREIKVNDEFPIVIKIIKKKFIKFNDYL